MLQTLADLLPVIAGLAMANPLPVTATILLLYAPRARALVPVYVAGWLLGLTLWMAVLVLVVPLERLVGTTGRPSALASVAHLLLGAALLALAAKQWRTRPRPGEQPHLPGWIGKLQHASPRAALGVGLGLGALNPRNLAFDIAGAIGIAQAQLPLPQLVALIVAFVLLGSFGVLVPPLWRLIGGQRAAAALDEWKTWLAWNFNIVMGVVHVLFGVMLVSKGLKGLLG
ncbi:MAG: GAP family protein [Thermomicrobiales bacterium]